MTPEQVRIIKLHKAWADRYMLVWLGFVLFMLTAAQYALEYFSITAAEHTGVLILLATILFISALWQAVGLGVARVHMIVRGINLER